MLTTHLVATMSMQVGDISRGTFFVTKPERTNIRS